MLFTARGSSACQVSEFDKSVHAPAEETDFFAEINGRREEGDEFAPSADQTHMVKQGSFLHEETGQGGFDCDATTRKLQGAIASQEEIGRVSCIEMQGM
jgi:hypothetical protein